MISGTIPENRRVFFLTGSFRSGGSERQAMQLARQLKDEGSFRIMVGCLDRDGEMLSEAEAINDGEVPEFRLTSFYDRNYIRQVRRCVRYIRDNQVGIIHTHDFYSNIFGMVAAKIAGVPIKIASKRETSFRTNRQFFIEKQAFRLSDRIIANADAVRDFIVSRGVSSAKVVTVYNGVDVVNIGSEPKRAREEVLRDYNMDIEAGRPIVLHVANMRSEVKNHRMVLRAAAKVKKEHANVAFVFAGEGELLGEYAAMAKEMSIDDVSYFVGRCDNVADLLHISSVGILSSRSEGFSNSVLEYMAAAKPVVATRVGGASEAVAHGETGYLVDSDDDAAMGRHVVELLSAPDLAVSMGAKGREVVASKFSVIRQRDAIVSLYRSLLT